MRVSIWGHQRSPDTIFLGSFIMAHLFIVFFRSNGNKKIYELYPYRFTLVPLVLFCAMCLSKWVAISASVCWRRGGTSTLEPADVRAESRIYDARAEQRRHRRHAALDFMLNLLIYAGPIWRGRAHATTRRDFQEYEADQILAVLAHGRLHRLKQSYLRCVVLAIGIPFIALHLFSYWRYSSRGTRSRRRRSRSLASTAAGVDLHLGVQLASAERFSS